MTIELIWGMCFGGGLVGTYLSAGNAFTHAMECRTKVKLTRLRFVLIMTVWPLFVLAWHMAPKDTRPPSPFSSRSQREEQNRIAVWGGEADWQDRWDFFTEQVREADNPVARERAEEHLRFLEETRPPRMKQLKPEPKLKPKKATLPSDFQQQLDRAALLAHKTPPKHMPSTSKVGFCNVCVRYLDAKFPLEGVCLECHEEQF